MQVNPESNIEKAEKSDAQTLLEYALRQEKLAKRGLWHQRIRTLLALLVAAAVLSAVGPVKATLNNVQLLTRNASYAVTELMNTVESLDLENTLDGVDQLVAESNRMVEDSAEDIQRSLQMIASLDVEGLNQSIQALEAVTTSIGKLFGYRAQ